MKLASSVLRGGEILPEKRVVDMTFTSKQRELVSIAGGQSVEFQSTRSIFRERDLSERLVAVVLSNAIRYKPLPSQVVRIPCPV